MDARDRLGMTLAGLGFVATTAGAFRISITVGLLVFGGLLVVLGIALGWRSS